MATFGGGVARPTGTVPGALALPPHRLAF